MVTTVGVGNLEATLAIGGRGQTRQAIIDASLPALPVPRAEFPAADLRPIRPNVLAIEAAPEATRQGPPTPIPFEPRREEVFSPRPEERYSRQRVDPRVVFHDLIEELREREPRY